MKTISITGKAMDKKTMIVTKDDFFVCCAHRNNPRTNPDYDSDCNNIVVKEGDLCPEHQVKENKMEQKTVNNGMPEMVTFVEGCTKVTTDWWESMKYKMDGVPVFSTKDGKRYIKVLRDKSIHCFVDKTNGDVLKAASWNTPAKHARGNIFDPKNGLEFMREFGPAYLRG